MSQSVSNPTNPNASVRKKRECNFYRQGKCLKGDACGFLHASTTSISAAQSPGSDFPGADPSQGPVAPGPPEGSRRTTGKGGAAATQPPLAIQANGGSGIRKKPCFAFRDGRCMKGLACTYSHDPQIRQDEIRRLQAIAEEEENRRMVEADARIRMGEEIRSRMEGETRRRKEEENRRRMEEGIRTRIEEEIRRRTEEKELRRREEAKEAERREEERLQRVQEQEAMDRRRAETERRRAEAERKRVAAERKRAERERRKREKEEREARERAEIERREAREARERAQRELAERQKRQREAAATLQVVVGGSNLVTFAAGFETRSIIPGFDLCAVVVRKFPSNATKGDVVHVFRSSLGMEGDQFHVVDLVFDSGSKKATVLTQTENTKGIEERALEGITFRDRYLEFELGANAMWGKMNDSGGGKDTDTLTIQWSCPSKTMILTYSTMGEAQTKARELDGTILHGRRIRAVMNTRPTGAAARYFVPESVKVTNVDMALQTDELEGIGDTDMVREVRSGVAYDLQDCIQTLEVRLRTYGAIPGSFQTSRLERSRMQAKARFPSSEAAQRAFTAIEDGSLGRNPPFHAFLPKGQQFTISIVRQQYNSQRTLWDDLAEGSNRNGAFVRVNESKSNGRMYINVLGSNQVEVGALKVRVENLVVGEPLASGYWHSSFLGTAGTALSTKIESTTGAYVTVDRRVQALRLFGTGPSKLAAKEVIREEVERLNFLEWSIPLQRQSVAFFVRSGLKTLQDALGEDNVSLNVSSRPATIKIKGGDDARHHLRKLMDEAAELVRSGLTVARKVDGGNACPICYDEVLSPDTLSCGHSYCEGCLRHYLTSAADAKTFPLICMGGEPTCGQPVAIPIIQRYLTASRMNRLVDAAFLAYLEQNPRTFKYCPTPDCSQIYRCDNTKESHQCPSCFFKICGKCDEEAHEGMTCEDARMQRNPAEQDPLGEEWALSNNAKRCPECRAMIIKEDGCNHVKCLCGTHFCWICLGVYSRLTIYMHMRYAHGGIRDAPAATPATPQAPATNVDDAQRLQQYMDGYLEVEAAQGRVEERNRLARRRDAEAWARERIREDMARAQQELTNQAPPTASNSEGSRCTIM